MKKPTFEEVDSIIFKYEQLAGNEFSSTELAYQIHALYNPPLKPLSELHKDREACEAIAEYFAMEYHTHQLDENNSVLISGESREDGWDSVITIWDDGDIFLESSGDMEAIPNPFYLADFIRGIGYDVQPETKKT
ncbi:MAG TPA: hypothetical protein VGN64_06155 [Dyadobacter sp.]|jgi:hypothetical protein|nr:hypothetical protein [Dyadobacter sp.]